MAIETRHPASPAPTDTTETLLDYLRRVFELERREDVREESFYSSLEELLVRCAGHLRFGDVRVTVIPKRREGNLLDFQVWRGGRPVGYVEAKRPGTDLQRVEGSPQLERYKKTFPNLILTNFHQFRLYRDGEPAARADIASSFAARLLPRELMAGAARVEGEPALLALLDCFFAFEAPWSGSASSLAVAMAARTRELATRMEEILDRDDEGTFRGLHQAFAEYLLGRLSRREFADLYAQTVAYGMLAARWRSSEGFDRAALFDRIPRTNGILRDVFRYISLGDPPPEVRWILDDLAHLLAAAPVREILERHFHAGRGKDPILHFYETFLASYDRDLRRRRGVFYTPQPVVSYVVRSVHRLLADRLGLDGGLAHPGVCLLDPAAGTLTFVAEALRQAAAGHRERFGDGAVPALMRDRLLPNFHAFELMMAPYAIGHLHLSLVLADLGFPLEEDDRFGLYLTDALDARELKQAALPGLSSLARESHLAGRLKKEVPEGCSAFVVVGNPPWLGHSSQRSAEVRDGYVARDGRRDEGYYRVDSRPLGEANPRWLQDDYVQFIRFAQRRIDEAGQGVLGFVTNHGYLDNPTFRGMRASLLGTFDELYVLDLHGNLKKKERAPDGSRDENVFEGVRQGVAIALFVKKAVQEGDSPRRVWRADLHGTHAEKLRWLTGNDVGSTPWRELRPEAPAYLFAPRDVDLEKEYLRGIPLPEVFPVHSAGVVTARDAFAIDRDRRELEGRIQRLRGTLPVELFPDARDTGTWSLEEARRRARADEDWRTRFQKILYRPFDERHVFYADYLLERPRENVMRHMLAGGNLGLVAPRQAKDGAGALVTDRIIAHKAVSAYDINYLFPLWLLPEEKDGLFEEEKRRPNLAPALLRFLGRLHGEEPDPQAVLGYVYAVLYSPTYRERYAPLLRQDFPRIPFAQDRDLFQDLAALGTELIGLHLLRALPSCPSAIFQGKGNGTPGRAGLPRYDPAGRRVLLNEAGQSFQGIEPEVWDYRIGGYQVLRRWLQARAGFRLTDDEIRTFCRTAAVLAETIRLQGRIDALYVEAGEGLLAPMAATL